jgi:hypothetical protein
VPMDARLCAGSTTDELGDPGSGMPRFVAAMTGAMVVLIDPHLTVVASSVLARAVTAAFLPGTNLARSTFLHPDDPDGTCRCGDAEEPVTAALRHALRAHEEDDAFRRIVGELSARSRAFSTAWASAPTTRSPNGVVAFRHPRLGRLLLRYHWVATEGLVHDLLLWEGEDPASRDALSRLVVESGAPG